MKRFLFLVLAVALFLCGAPIALYGLFLQYDFWWNMEFSIFNPFWRLEALAYPAFWEATITTLVGASLVHIAGFLTIVSEDK